jgi:two-component system response regulator FixJ
MQVSERNLFIDAAHGDGSREIPSSLVYVVDDDSMVRRSLSFSLTARGLECRAFASGRDFLDASDELMPGCVLLDVRMPEMDGIAVLDELGPRIGRFAVVVMTGHGDVDIAVRAMKHGARDFLEKPFTDIGLAEALNLGFSALPAQVRAYTERAAAAELAATLTPRERDVLRGLVAGLSNKKIAEGLGVGARTVEMHRGKLMKRLGVQTVADAVLLAYLAAIEPL